MQKPRTEQHWALGQVATPWPHGAAGAATGVGTLVRSMDPGHWLRRPENSHWQVEGQAALWQMPSWLQHWWERQRARPARQQQGRRGGR